MTEQIHGHEVMKMMLARGQSFTRETLHAAIIAEFGNEARFFTCSAQDMTAEQLIDFLESRGKFVDTGDGFNTQAGKICSH